MARLAPAHAGSIADAHIGATIVACARGDVVVLTSDPKDIRAVAGSRAITVVAL